MTSFDSNFSSKNDSTSHDQEHRLLPAEFQAPAASQVKLIRTDYTTPPEPANGQTYSVGQSGQGDIGAQTTQTPPNDGVIRSRQYYGNVAPGALAATAPTDGSVQYQPTAPMQPGSPWDAQRQAAAQAAATPDYSRYTTGQGGTDQTQQVGNGQITQGQGNGQIAQGPTGDASGRTGSMDQYTTPTDHVSSSGSGGSMFGGLLGSGLTLGASLYARNKFLSTAGAEVVAGEAISKDLFTKANLLDQTKAPLTKALIGGWLGNELMDHTILANKETSWKTIAVDIGAPFLAASVFGKTGGLIKPLATVMGAHFLEKQFLEGDKQ